MGASRTLELLSEARLSASGAQSCLSHWHFGAYIPELDKTSTVYIRFSFPWCESKDSALVPVTLWISVLSFSVFYSDRNSWEG